MIFVVAVETVGPPEFVKTLQARGRYVVGLGRCTYSTASTAYVRDRPPLRFPENNGVWVAVERVVVRTDCQLGYASYTFRREPKSWVLPS